MNNIALYTKYRPKTFGEIYGQDAIVQTLRNEVKAGRISNSYLFYGLRGSGKTSIARIFARAINCESINDGEPCQSCKPCSEPIDIIEMDAASNNNIDNIRKLVEEVKYVPTIAKYKIYIIDEVHMLSTSAFNVLLKTIEEPPSHIVFIFCTTELNKVPDTIKSRCQMFNFKSISENNIITDLKEILKKEQCDKLDKDDILTHIAKKANGSLRDAVSMLDQCICQFMYSDTVSINDIRKSFGDPAEDVILSLKDCINSGDIQKGLDIIHEQYYNGVVLQDLFQMLYNEYFNDFQYSFGKEGEPERIGRYIRIIAEAIAKIEHSSNILPMCEITFIRLCKPEMETNYDSLILRLHQLENVIRNGSSISLEEFEEAIEEEPKQVQEIMSIVFGQTVGIKLKEDC